MSIAAAIRPQLPYLRRFSRALAGSQASGDSYVAALLESLIADPGSLSGYKDARIGLYAGLCKLWNSIDLNSRADETPHWEETVRGRLAAMSGTARQVFLLHTLEGFDLEEVAQIQGKSVDLVRKTYADTSRMVSEMLASDVLVIEDEPLIALDLEDIVTSLGHRCVGVARTRDEAVALAKAKAPQLVLSDIHLADGSSGIDAVGEILKTFNVPVIFITAFPERLLTGDKPEPAFLITKPFSPDMVRAIIAQALFFNMKAGATN